jgi:hypothetical protein
MIRFIACLFAVIGFMLFATPSHAAGNSQRVIHTKFKAIESVTTSAHGTARRKAEFKKRSLYRDRIVAMMVVPLPSVTPAIADEAAAATADIRLSLSREGVKYAECLMPLSALESETEEGVTTLSAQYKVDIEITKKKRGTSMRVRRGSCDTDLATEGLQQGVPQLKKGDIATIGSAVAGETEIVLTDFLTGSFK